MAYRYPRPARQRYVEYYNLGRNQRRKFIYNNISSWFCPVHVHEMLCEVTSLGGYDGQKTSICSICLRETMIRLVSKVSPAYSRYLHTQKLFKRTSGHLWAIERYSNETISTGKNTNLERNNQKGTRKVGRAA